MATTKVTNPGELPYGFVSPFKRVEMQGTHDDLLACVATLTGKTLDEVKKLAITLGMPAHGPYLINENMVSKLLFNLGNLSVSDYKNFTDVAALPDVAILCVDYDEASEASRHLVYHHVRSNQESPSFSYVIDVGNWLDPKYHVTTDMRQLRMDPSWFMEVKQRPSPTGKSK